MHNFNVRVLNRLARVLYREVRVSTLVTFPQLYLPCHSQQYAPSYYIPSLTLNFIRLVSKSSTSITCWNCQKSPENTALFCEGCHVIQTPTMTQNYFDLLSLEQDYDLDIDLLSKKYKDMQRLLHPDKFTLKSEVEQDIAAEYSSLVNKAYSTLRNPFLRGTYLLQLNGIAFDETTSVDDSSFLFRVMEINEEIAEADGMEALKLIQKDNSVEIESVIRSLTQAFQSNDLEIAKRHLITLRYLTNISEKISEKLYSLGERL